LFLGANLKQTDDGDNYKTLPPQLQQEFVVMAKMGTLEST